MPTVAIDRDLLVQVVTNLREMVYLPDHRRRRREVIEQFYELVDAANNDTSEPTGPVTMCPDCGVPLGACPECGETPDATSISPTTYVTPAETDEGDASLSEPAEYLPSPWVRGIQELLREQVADVVPERYLSIDGARRVLSSAE